MKKILFESPIGSDGGYQIYYTGRAICFDCNYLFDGTTGERTEVYANFSSEKYQEAINTLDKNGECYLENQNGDFFKMKLIGKSKINIHFGMKGGPQFTNTEKATPKDFLLS